MHSASHALLAASLLRNVPRKTIFLPPAHMDLYQATLLKQIKFVEEIVFEYLDLSHEKVKLS